LVKRKRANWTTRVESRAWLEGERLESMGERVERGVSANAFK
jgi:hypothetical protein